MTSFLSPFPLPTVPLRCGHGFCDRSQGRPQNSLLGPGFIDYEEPPYFCSPELISCATDLNNIAWINSGLQNRETKWQGMYQARDSHKGLATSSQMGFSGMYMMHGHMCFEEGQNRLIGMMTEILSTQMPTRQSFAMPTEVKGLS